MMKSVVENAMKNIVGKTVAAAYYHGKYDSVDIVFTDGTTLKVIEVGHVGQLEVRVEGEVIEDEYED